MTDTNFTDYSTPVPAAWLNDINDHVYNHTPISPAVTVHPATVIANTPAGSIVATTVQAAIDELDTEKASLSGCTFTGTVVGTTFSPSANLTFTGTGNRITGDFSNATVANRVMLQSSTVNGNTIVGVLPNGTGTVSSFVLEDKDFGTGNSSFASLANNYATDFRLTAGIRGSGSYLPITFHTGGSERVRIATSGRVGFGRTPTSYRIEAAGGIYSTDVGAGGNPAVVLRGHPSLDIGEVGTLTNHPIIFITNSAERMRIDDSGVLSMGTTLAQKMNWYVSGNTKYGVSIASGEHRIYTPTGNSIILGHMSTADGTTFTDRLKVDGSGNVGIGISPTYYVHAYKAAAEAPFVSDYGGARSVLSHNNSYGYTGTLTNQAFVIVSNAIERVRIDTSGNTTITSAAGLGYGTGAGTTGTQATSRVTTITLAAARATGSLTLFSTAGSTSWSTCTVANVNCAATDTIIVNQKSGTDLYEIHVTAVAANQFNITFRTTGGTTSEAPVFNFAVIKAVTS